MRLTLAPLDAASDFQYGIVAAAAAPPPVVNGYTTVQKTGSDANRIQIVFLGDGYTAGQIATTYAGHVGNAIDYLFDDSLLTQPFGRYSQFFNIYAVNVVSNESGADKETPGKTVDTALGATFFADGITDRLLDINVALGIEAMNAGLQGTGIVADIKFVAVNTDTYGGAGGSFATFAGGNSAANELALHEVAHSFVGLADEYTAAGTGGQQGSRYDGPEPSTANITISPTGQKWAQWLGYDQPGIGVIGAYEGAGYYDTGLYRPSQNSKMRSLGQPFDAVSREQFVLRFYELVDPIDSATPAGKLTDPAKLNVKVIDSEVIKLRWSVDGVVKSDASLQEFVFESFNIASGTHQVTALAYDPTDWVRIADRSSLQQQVSWTVTLNQATLRATGAAPLVGGELIDRMFGDGAANVMSGGAGDDELLGEGGNDQLTGGAGDDRIIGGDGADTAFFADAFADCTFAFFFNQCIVTTATEGQDLLYDVETLDFAGVKYDVAALKAQAGPGIIDFSPDDGAGRVAVSSDFVLTFSDRVARGTGTITLRDAAGTVIESFDAATAGNIYIQHDQVRISPTANLAPGEQYRIVLEAGNLVGEVGGKPSPAFRSYDFTTNPIGEDPNAFRLFASDGHIAMLGGAGMVIGTSKKQIIEVRDLPGTILFDPSFNGGGDTIRIYGDLAHHTIVRSGSSARISDGDTTLIIPVGTTPIRIAFTDGVRKLVYDQEAGTMKIGDQAFANTEVPITAFPNDVMSDTGFDVAATGRLYLRDGGDVLAGGMLQIFGTNGAESVELVHGNVTFDPSFNRGGDLLVFDYQAERFTALRQGSSVILKGPDIAAQIPVGTAGMTLDFEGDLRTLLFDAQSGQVLIGDHVIGATPTPLGVTFG